MNAPGAAELRTAGCDVGLVTDLTKVGSMLGLDAGSAATSGPRVMVLCQMQGNKAGPSCKQVSAAYRKARDAAGRQFIVQVSARPRSQPLCQEIYSQKGVLLPSQR